MKIVKPSEVSAAYKRGEGRFGSPGAIKSSLRLLKSGAEADYFSDLDYQLNDPLSCEDTVLLYTDAIQRISRRHRVDFLGFIEKPTGGARASGGTVGAIRLAGAITICTSIPNVTIRLAKHLSAERVKLPYEPSRPTGERLGGANVVLVTDHCSTGRELLSATDTIRENGGRVSEVVTYTIRPELTRWQEFQDREIEIHAIYRLPEAPQKAGIELPV